MQMMTRNNGPQMKNVLLNFINLKWAALFMLAFSTSLQAADLNSMDIGASDEGVIVKFSLSDAINEPYAFTTDNPPRIIVDLTNVENKLEQRSKSVNSGSVSNISVIQAGDRTRVVISLLENQPYSLETDNDSFTIFIQDKRNENIAVSSAVNNVVPEITGVDFRRGEEGQARFIITMSSDVAVANVRDDKGNVFVELPGTVLPDSLHRVLDVVDFSTPVTFIESIQKPSHTGFLLTTKGNHEFLSYQSKNELIVEIKELTENVTNEANEFGFSGDKLSLNFQNIEVRSVLQLLADFTGMNLVTSDTVQGNLTLRLKDVPWDQALDIILKSKGLAMRQSGNVMMVAPAAEIAAREKQELDARNQLEELEELYTEIIEVKFAKASDIETLLKTSSSNTSASSNSSFLSRRGNVTVDDRTNSLLIQDTSEQLAKIKKVIDELDKPVRQVLIESRIVIANDDFDNELGVRFGAATQTDKGALGNIAIAGNIEGTRELLTDDTTNPTVGNSLNVDLPAASPTGTIGLALSKLPLGAILQLELSAMEAEGKGEIISSPKVITANQRQATIEQGTEIPYQEASSSGATSVSFKEAVLKLDVTPQITPDDRIIMDLVVSQDQVGTVFQNVPSIDTREVATQVLVNNGETVVLGGIYEQTKTNSVERVPFFGDLPYVGFLFKTTQKSDTKRELLVFVTPKIVKEGLQY
jgi:type IV pilus assembly protein PilQ